MQNGMAAPDNAGAAADRLHASARPGRRSAICGRRWPRRRMRATPIAAAPSSCEAKQACAPFYIERILPETAVRLARITTGAANDDEPAGGAVLTASQPPDKTSTIAFRRGNVMTEAFIYDAVRTPRGRGKPDGALHEVSTLGLAVSALDRAARARPARSRAGRRRRARLRRSGRRGRRRHRAAPPRSPRAMATACPACRSTASAPPASTP